MHIDVTQIPQNFKIVYIIAVRFIKYTLFNLLLFISGYIDIRLVQENQFKRNSCQSAGATGLGTRTE